MIVVDTSVWIDFLEARGTPFASHLSDLIDKRASVALTDVIYCEVLQGILDDGKYGRTQKLLREFPILRVRGLLTFEHAAQIYRSCRRRGFAVRRVLDCLIAATCIEAVAELYQNDRDFEAIARVQGLRLYRPRKF